ncbi:MAG: hypothetical protein R6W68_14890 [Ignavibacteriaceae bacterium]
MKHFAIDDLSNIIIQTGVTIDKEVTADGNGSLRIVSNAPSVIQLYETGYIDAEDAALFYYAKVKCENVQGQVYLEMWCIFEGKGEYFSRGLENSIAGSTDWTGLQTNFFLNPGENPDNIKLNLVVAGTGIVWIDDIKLVKK